MKVRVLLFGSLSESYGESSFELENVRNITDILNILKKTNPSIEKMKFAVAVNQRVVNRAHKLNNGDEVALLPPFAGG